MIIILEQKLTIIILYISFNYSLQLKRDMCVCLSHHEVITHRLLIVVFDGLGLDELPTKCDRVFNSTNLS